MALWTPAEITTALWLDAADSDTITLVSGNVSQWDDKSGSNHQFAQSTSALQPAYNTTQNDLNTIDFNEDYLQSDEASSAWKWLHDATTKYAFFGVVKPKDSDNRVIWGTNTGSADTIGANLRRDGAAGLANRAVSYWVTRGSTGYRVLKYTDAGAISDNTWAVVTLDSDLANATVSDRGLITVDGQSAGDNNYSTDNYSASTANPTGTLRIGSNSTNSTPFVGEMAELVFLDYEATTDTRQKIEGYLAWKWGLEANLPTGHPYESAAPTSTATVTVTSSTATEVNSRSAILQGSLTDLGGETSVSVYFEYGPTTSYGSTTDALTLSAIGDFSAKITDFDESTTYHFRAVASDGVTAYNGADQSLTTTACPFELTGTPSLESIYWSWEPVGEWDTWQPGVFTNLMLWLKADQIENLTSGDVVEEWIDQSQNQYTLTNVGSPTYAENILSGLPGVYFHSGNWIMAGNQYPFATALKTGVTFFAVIANTASIPNQGAFVFDFGLFAGAGYGLIFDNSDMFIYTSTGHGGATTTESVPLSVSVGSFHIAGGTITFSSTQSMFLDGALLGSSAITLDRLDVTTIAEAPTNEYRSGPFTVGAQSKNQYRTYRYFPGYICELMVFDKAMSESERQEVEGYLAHKWGLTANLEATHPYKTTGPE